MDFFNSESDMDTLLWAAEALASPMLSESARISMLRSEEDQRFLLVFIMGTYFGPDVKAENPKKSALQRIAEGLPAYTSDQLTGSEMKMADAEQVYYYALGKANEAVVLRPSLLHEFFQGNLNNQEMGYPVGDHRQFPDLFPTHLHPQYDHEGQYKIIQNVVFINNPQTSYMKQEDIERFKRLSGLEDFMLDRNAATCGSDGISNTTDSSKQEDFMGSEGDGISNTTDSSKQEDFMGCEGGGISNTTDSSKQEDFMSPVDPLKTEETNCHLKAKPLSPFHGSQSQTKSASFPTVMKEESNVSQELEEIAGPAMLLLPSRPTKQQWDNIVAATVNGIQYYGSIAERPVGPLIGLTDIGECEDAYFFRVSLPGVCRNETEFSCKVEPDGRVMIKGCTVTGQKYITRFSQIFEMQTQNLSPPGPFTVSFKLPGPVDPKEFTGNFGEDGMLEGIVLKQQKS